MKQYAITVSVYIHDKATTYPEVKPIDFQIKENLPANISPQKYLRQRISEELTRHFAAQSVPIENVSDEQKADGADPLKEPF